MWTDVSSQQVIIRKIAGSCLHICDLTPTLVEQVIEIIQNLMLDE